MLLLHVRVQPGASRDEIAGRHGNPLKLRLSAHPVDGKANKRLIEFLADICAVARSDVAIVSGRAGRDKRVRVTAPKALPAGVKPTGL